MNTYKTYKEENTTCGMYVLELSKEDAQLVAEALQNVIYDDSRLRERAEYMGGGLQMRMEIEGDWKEKV